MSIAIFTLNEKQSQRWSDVLKKELPSHSIEVYPSITNFESIELLICWKPYKGLIDKFPNLKAIQSLGAGVDHIFENNDINPSIEVSKVVDHQLTHDMWEHTLAIVLSDMKHLPLHRQNQLENIWKPKRYKRFKDVSIGVLGLGTIGSYVARHFSDIGFNVLGWSKSEKTINNVETHVGDTGLASVCEHSDYLINILPLTSETQGILDTKFFSKMKPSSYLINVGRGGHLVDQDLIDHLDSEHLRGAALDVFHVEPLPSEHPFWKHPKILITPHIASLTHIDSVYPQVVENIRLLDQGKPLQHAIDVVKMY